MRLDAADGLIFRDAVVVDVDLSGQRIPIFQAAATLFERCDFSGSRITDAATLGALPWATYRDCVFQRTDLRRAAPSIARFERCTFDHARLDKWFSTQAEFVDCRFVGTLTSLRFYGTVIPQSSALGRTRNEFAGNDFSEAELTDVSFVHGIDIGAQRWPSSPDYAVIQDLPRGLAAAQAEIERWPDGRERADALEMLHWMQGVYAGQPGAIRRRGQLSETTERIWSIVEEASAARRG